jgi:predicted MFS family arabinose efflux permease
MLRPSTDRRTAAAANYALQLLGSLVLVAGCGTDTLLLLLGIVLFGLGLGNAASLPPLIAQSNFAPPDTARAVALVTALSQAAYAFAPAAFGVLRAGFGAEALFLSAAAIQAAAAPVLLQGRSRSV